MRAFLLFLRLWFLSSLIFSFFFGMYILSAESQYTLGILILLPLSMVIGLPGILIQWLGFLAMKDGVLSFSQKITRSACVSLFLAAGYSICFRSLADQKELVSAASITFAALIFLTNMIAVAASHNGLRRFLMPAIPESDPAPSIEIQTINTTDMSHNTTLPGDYGRQGPLSKGLLTGLLILAMLIPTFFISNIVVERQSRRTDVVKEVTEKWAGAQRLTGPYLFVPYTRPGKDEHGKPTLEKSHLIFLPDNMETTGAITPEERKRSIYTVLLYHASLQVKGNFVLNIPDDVDTALIEWKNAQVCAGISDLKGIEQKVDIKVDNQNYTLAPGLPTEQLDKQGLSAPVAISAGSAGQSVAFAMPLLLRGSEALHFIPLAGNSRFFLHSAWASPSFDGNTLPTERNVSDSGFTATWAFNKANLPFNTVLHAQKMETENYAVGITMVQPADQYSKTSRSVKYAILVIGLTLSLFFIVELMQKKPMHAVQYALIGLALVIFYTLLLSMSEFISFDLSFLIASLATVTLVTLYAKSHFGSWRVTFLFTLVLSALYGFMFVLIRLEDTALLVGSIGLFIVLSLVMYASRRINWQQGAFRTHAESIGNDNP